MYQVANLAFPVGGPRWGSLSTPQLIRIKQLQKPSVFSAASKDSLEISALQYVVW